MSTKAEGSQLFQPFRALGFITDQNRFVLQKRRADNFVTVSIGKSFQIFNCSKLTLVFVGAQHDKRIRALAAFKDYTFTASGSSVFVWKRAKLQRSFNPAAAQLASSDSAAGQRRRPAAAVVDLLVLGEQLLALSDDNRLTGWHIYDGHKTGEEEVQFADNFHVTAMVHPHTYLNKVLFGSREGTLQLWNIKTGKMIFSFKHPEWKAAVQCLEQSPAVDVIGIGLADGSIVVHNVKLDQTVVTFRQAEGSVTCMSFRSDEQAVLATGSNVGSVALWDLDKKKLLTVAKDMHDGTVTCARFLSGEPVLLTAGVDNSLKMWLFDQPDGSARLLRSRTGHSAPPSLIRYYGADGSKDIVTCAGDHSLRFFSTIQDQQSRELSQGKGIARKARKFGLKDEELKLPPIVQFYTSAVKEKEWDNVITCHADHPTAHTWSFQNKVIGQHAFASKDPNPTVIKSVTISSCGNFGFVGSASGWLDKYNMQSGIHRGSYKALPSGAAHGASVEGLCVELLNRTLISASLDATVKFWDVHSLQLLDTLAVGAPVSKLSLHKDSALLAVGCDDLAVRLYDIDTRKLVRRFDAHSAHLTDLTFSHDSRWLVTATTDQVVRVWDLPSGRMIDWFRADKAVTSLTFSPDGDFLATSHVGSVGVFLWTNQMHFSRVLLGPPPSRPPSISMPVTLLLDELDSAKDKAAAGGEPARKKPKIEPQQAGTAKIKIENNHEAENEEDEEAEEDGAEDEEADVVSAGRSRADAAGGPAEKADDSDAAEANGGAEHERREEVLEQEQLAPGLITLSNLPKARWQSLANLDVIKRRNRPKEPPKKPEQAPFFLPTLPGLVPTFTAAPSVPADASDAATAGGPGAPRSRILDFAELADVSTAFTNLLDEAEQDQKEPDYLPAVEHLKGLGPAAIDLEFQTLSLANDYRRPKQVMRMLEACIDTSRDFNVVQALLNVFLKYHGETIIGDAGLLELAQRLRRKQREHWLRLDSLCQNNLCLIKYFSGIQTG